MSVAKLRRFAGEKGSILVMTAVSLTALMGITAWPSTPRCCSTCGIA
jgi:hypothetical protein